MISEAVSLIKAFLWKKVIIFTNLLNVLKAINNQRKKIPFKINYILSNITSKLYKLHCNQTEVTLCWVPAHKGIPGNKIADSVAKEATSLRCKPTFGIPFSDFYTKSRTILNNMFKAYLEKAALHTGMDHAILYQRLSKKTLVLQVLFE